MKKIVLFLLVMSSIMFFTRCDSDDSLNNETKPELSNFVTEISSMPGLEIKFQGLINEDVGIGSVQIYYPEWSLNKKIELTEKVNQYVLNYKFLVPENAIEGTSHTVEIIVTDKAGNESKINILVTLNLDIINPTVQFVAPQNGISHIVNNPLNINVNATDNVSLKSLQVKCEALNFNNTVNFTAGENTFDYVEQIQIPNGVLGNITIEAIATDMNNNVSTTSTTILLSVTQVFTQMYIVGGSTWFGSDPTKATKMWQDPQNSQVFIGEFYYKTGMGIKFLGQLASSPNNWGLNPNNNSQIINSQNSQAINFPNGDGYYRITFNPYQQIYNYQLLNINIPERNNMYVMGKGYVGYALNWSPSNGIPMTKDPNNPYVFRIDIQFSNEVELKFLGQNNDWGPYDAGFVEGGQKQLPINYVKGVTGSGTPDLKFTNQAGNYRILFDYFLLRTTIQPL